MVTRRRGAVIEACVLMAAGFGYDAAVGAVASHQEPRPRVRELGVSPGVLPTGSLNAITDVAGVRIGHVTLVEGQDVRTGVTAVLPHVEGIFRQKVAAGVYTGNGYGKAAGFEQVRELGVIESPIVLTNTLSVGTAVEAIIEWTLQQPGNEEVRSVNAIVGETNDGFLNDIRGRHVTREHVIESIERAQACVSNAIVQEGSVGAGTGTMCFGFKGGIGTSSRELPDGLGGYTVGVLVQSNFGGILTIDGSRVGEALGRYSFRREIERIRSGEDVADENKSGDGSCMIVIATDTPLDGRQLERLAKRAIMGLARTGSFMSHGSGDFIIAFSTANRMSHGSNDRTCTVEILRDDQLSPLFLAVVEATEEAVYNSLTKATPVQGRDGHIAEAIPIERLRELSEPRD